MISSVSSMMHSQAAYAAQHAAAKNTSSTGEGSASEEARETPAQEQAEQAAKSTSFQSGQLDVTV